MANTWICAVAMVALCSRMCSAQGSWDSYVLQAYNMADQNVTAVEIFGCNTGSIWGSLYYLNDFVSPFRVEKLEAKEMCKHPDSLTLKVGGTFTIQKQSTDSVGTFIYKNEKNIFAVSIGPTSAVLAGGKVGETVIGLAEKGANVVEEYLQSFGL